MLFRVTTTIGLVIAGVAVLVGIGCESEDSPPPRRANTAPATEAAPPSPWRIVDDSAQIAIDDDDVAAQLEAATAQALATLGNARSRWEAAEADTRDQWWIKWAAPSIDERPEYLWVRPVSWSKFRVEGVLASPPQLELPSGRGLGDLVSFPVEEIADWMYLPDGSLDSGREGGFTVDVLESRYGHTPVLMPEVSDD